jgi:hypothetical protein
MSFSNTDFFNIIFMLDNYFMFFTPRVWIDPDMENSVGEHSIYSDFSLFKFSIYLVFNGNISLSEQIEG